MSRFLVRLVDGGDTTPDTSFSGCLSRIKRQADAIGLLRAAFAEAELFIDPFGLALGANDMWGATSNGELHLGLTAEMFRNAVTAYAQAGADWVLTLGRFDREVLVAREAIQASGKRMRVCTFSTNTEATQAYAYTPKQEEYKDSRQKVLPQNFTEMLVWALADLAAGAEMVIIKPGDNLHLLMKVMELALCPDMRQYFLARDTVKGLASRSPFVSDMLTALQANNQPIAAQFGSYAISGKYTEDQIERERKGTPFFLTRLFERFVSIASAAELAGGSAMIFDRNAFTYLSH